MLWQSGGMSDVRDNGREAYAAATFVTLPAWWDSVRAAGEALRPGIQLGAYEAGLVAWLLRLRGVTRVLEVGGFVGASALAMVHAVPGATVVTLERDAKAAALAAQHFAAHGQGRVTLLEGDALAVLASPGLQAEAPFDALFIDAEKRQYPDYLEAALPLLKPGALILADNTLLFGAMAGEEPRARVSAEAKAAMTQFHAMLADRARFDAVLLPTEEGLTVAILRESALR